MNAVTLGQQFQAIATGGDRIPSKNPDGKTYREIIPDLEDFFEPKQHSEFKTGYDNKTQRDTFYCYVKWQHIRKRLDDVAGRDGWIVERTGMFVDEAGMPVLIGRMNILGVVKEAMGFGKAHEKWKGTRIENAEADLMKNLAEAHGVGRYLDNQQQVIRHLWDNADGDEYIKSMARKLGVQYSLNLQAEIRENNKEQGLGKNSIPKPQPSSPKPHSSSPDTQALITSEQQKQLWAIARGAGHQDSGVKAVLKAYGYTSVVQVEARNYEGICAKLGDKNLVPIYSGA
jgi:hypothetical protein